MIHRNRFFLLFQSIIITIFKSSHCNSFEDRIPEDFIYPIFKWTAIKSLKWKFLNLEFILSLYIETGPRIVALAVTNRRHIILYYVYECFYSRLWHTVVLKWKRFPRYCSFVKGNHRSPVDFPSQRASDVELCWYPEQSVEQTLKSLSIWDTITFMWRHCNLCYLFPVDWEHFNLHSSSWTRR